MQPSKRQKIQHFQSARCLVATRCLLLSQGHAGIHGKDVDQLQRGGLSTAFVGPAQGLAVDGHDPGKLEAVGLGKGCHEATKGELEGLRLEQTKHPAECIVTRDAMLQAKNEPQQLFLRLSEVRHVRARLRSAQRRRQRDEQHLQKIVPGIVRARVRQPPKGFLELVHPTPSMIRESSSESVLPSNAIAVENPYAIPLPRAGRGRRASSECSAGEGAHPQVLALDEAPPHPELSRRSVSDLSPHAAIAFTHLGCALR